MSKVDYLKHCPVEKCFYIIWIPPLSILQGEVAPWLGFLHPSDRPAGGGEPFVCI